MQEKTPHITVIIPHLNQQRFLEQCLSSLDAQTLERDQFEVIVVDNGSSESRRRSLRSIKEFVCWKKDA